MQDKNYSDKTLKRIKENVKSSFDFYSENYKLWHESRHFSYVTTLLDKDIEFLRDIKKPEIECNLIPAYLARLLGEFATNQPEMTVGSHTGRNVSPQIIQLVEDNFRYSEYCARRDGEAVEIMDEILSGAFSVGKIWTEYENQKSMKQVLKWGKVDDPTMVGFDPKAKKTHKGDGRWAVELFPYTKEEFKSQFPKIDIDSIKFVRGESKFGDYSWSYVNNTEKILVLAHYYEKKMVKTELYELANGKTMTKKEYEEFSDEWDKEMRVEQKPKIARSRDTELEIIVRYDLIEDQVIDYVETDLPGLPYVWAIGSAKRMRKENGIMHEYCQPFSYHSKGMQRAKNAALQSIVYEVDNSMQCKIKAPIEGIPENFKEAYEDPQTASALLYHQFQKGSDIRLDPPQEMARPPVPEAFMQLFMASDSAIQNIIGSYDAALGINNNQLSGSAIAMGSMNSNATAKPYINGYINFLNRIAELYIKLLPKYVTEDNRDISGMDKNGKMYSTQINSTTFNYGEYDLSIKIEAGANFSVQKNLALKTITELMNASPAFAQFINAKGLNVILDNLEIRGLDMLKALALEYMQELKAQQQQMMQQQQKNIDPQQIALQKLEIEKEKLRSQTANAQSKNAIMAAEVSNTEETNNIKKMQLASTNQRAKVDQMLALDKHNAEKTRASVDMAVSINQANTQKIHESHRLGHEISKTMLEHKRYTDDKENQQKNEKMQSDHKATPKEKTKKVTKKPK